MTMNFFMSKLLKVYPKMTEYEISDNGEFVSGFSEDDIGRLWDVVEELHLVATAPKRGHLIKYAKSIGISTESKSGALPLYAQVCYVCCANGRPYRYSVEDRKCPTCGDSHKPFHPYTKRGTEISREKAQRVVDQYPPGPHPLATEKKGNLGSKRVERLLEDMNASV